VGQARLNAASSAHTHNGCGRGRVACEKPCVWKRRFSRRRRASSGLSDRDGGEGGIRTLGGREPSLVFKTSAFNRSATSPLRNSRFDGGEAARRGPWSLDLRLASAGLTAASGGHRDSTRSVV